MNKIIIVFVLTATLAFGQERYSIGYVDVNESNLYIDEKGELITGIIVDNGARYDLDNDGNGEEAESLPYKSLEYDVVKGKVTNTRFFDDNNILVAEGMMDDEDGLTGNYYFYRENGSLQFKVIHKDGVPTEGFCVQGKTQRALTKAELNSVNPPACE